MFLRQPSRYHEAALHSLLSQYIKISFEVSFSYFFAVYLAVFQFSESDNNLKSLQTDQYGHIPTLTDNILFCLYPSCIASTSAIHLLLFSRLVLHFHVSCTFILDVQQEGKKHHQDEDEH